MGYGFKILVEGERACFTRPEFKVERVSYDCITPSAARGIIEAIYWKPAIRWLIDKIVVLNEIAFASIQRNEVNDIIKPKTNYLNVDDCRTQRLTTYLKNVAYIIDFHFDLTENTGKGDTKEKHYNIALRRLQKGQSFNQPYLGCREFPAYVSLLNDSSLPFNSFYADDNKKDLGYMLYDIDFDNDMTPWFMRAVMRRGVIDVEKARQELMR